MADKNSSPQTTKRMLENPWVGSLVVPLAILLTGALIVFGVTTMLSTDRSYKDLVREMQSKTFGNRWVAAYELSKVLATSSVPKEDVPWLIENLGSVYDESSDPRTREFVIAAFSSLDNELTLPWLIDALGDDSPKVQFHAIVALGNMSSNKLENWAPVYDLLNSDDHALRHAAVLTLATHKVENANDQIARLMSDPVLGVRFAAATALITYQDSRALPMLKEILLLEAPSQGELQSPQDGLFNSIEVANLKINVMHSLKRSEWDELNPTLERLVEQEENKQVVTRAQEVLNQLKN
jgi:hypothetical protein